MRPQLWLISRIGGLVTLLSVSCAAGGDASAILPLSPGSSARPGLQIAYGTELYRAPGPSETPAPALLGPDDLPAWLQTHYSARTPGAAAAWAEHALHARGPGVIAENQTLCVQSQPPFYFDFEAGLRLRYCLPLALRDADDLRGDIAAVFAAVLAGSAGSLPFLDIHSNDSRLRVFASTPGRLRQSIGPVLISADGFRRPVLARWRLAGSEARFAYTSSSYGARFGATERALPLPRRFPRSESAVLVGASEIYWLYQPPAAPGTLLVIAIQDAEAAQLLRETLARLPEYTAREIARAATQRNPLQVSEAYFRAQRGQHRPLSKPRANEFFELTARTPVFARIRVRGDTTSSGAELDRPLFLFAHSTWLVEREQSPGLRWNNRFEFQQARPDQDPAFAATIPRSYELPAPAPAARSLEWNSSAATITRFCRDDLPEYAGLCANPGLGPAFVRILQELAAQKQILPDCTTADFTLSEINPTGVLIPPNTVDRSGKFVELRVARRCRSGRVLFRAGPALLDPGSGRTLDPEQPLLFLVDPAARQLFDFGGDPAQLAFAPALRHISADSLRVTAIELRDITGPDRATDTRETIIASLAAETAHWSGSGRAFRSGEAFRAVHSLGPLTKAAPETALGYAHGPGRGLRPDLVSHNAMSPGRFAGADSRRALAELPRVQLAEVLPEGERLADGSSRPTAEFLELRLSGLSGADSLAGHGEFAALSLTAHARSGGSFRALLPYPESADSRPVLVRESSACFADAAVRAYALPDLRLPDGPAEYQLRALPFAEFASNPAHADRLVISAADYAALSPDSAGHVRPRRSYARSFIEESGMAFAGPSDGSAAVSPHCGASTQATPGRRGGFAPRLLELPGQRPFPAGRWLQLYSEAGPLWIHWRIGLPEPRANGLISSGAITSSGDPVRLLSGGAPLWIPAPNTSNVPGIPAGIRQLVRVTESGQNTSLYTGELFAEGAALFVERVQATPAAGQHEWLRLCSTVGFAWPTASARLQLRDRTSTDTVVPARDRFTAGLTLPTSAPPHISQSARELSAGSCAIVVDPDYDGHALPWLPADQALWTIASSAALGNGLSADEALDLFWQLPARLNVPAAACPGDTQASGDRCYSLSRFEPDGLPYAIALLTSPNIR